MFEVHPCLPYPSLLTEPQQQVGSGELTPSQQQSFASSCQNQSVAGFSKNCPFDLPHTKLISNSNNSSRTFDGSSASFWGYFRNPIVSFYLSVFVFLQSKFDDIFFFFASQLSYLRLRRLMAKSAVLESFDNLWKHSLWSLSALALLLDEYSLSSPFLKNTSWFRWPLVGRDKGEHYLEIFVQEIPKLQWNFQLLMNRFFPPKVLQHSRHLLVTCCPEG